MDFAVMFFIYSLMMSALVLFGAIYLLRKLYYSRRPQATKNFVAKVFRSHGALRGWKVLQDVTIGSGDAAVTVDQLVVAPFGVIVACDLFRRGNVYGELEGDHWILTIGEDGKEKKRDIIENHYLTARRGEEQLRKLFAQNKIYSVPVEVMVPKTGKQGSYITGSGEYMYSCKELKAQIARTRYDKDSGVDIDRIVALFVNTK